ncbi:MAG: hypothetical protein EAZ62_02940 [Sphingobacteriia bacterium]|nr:MAG: hypothetical protein EAZ62_02940 [Sphingobacteriia bacterium]
MCNIGQEQAKQSQLGHAGHRGLGRKNNAAEHEEDSSERRKKNGIHISRLALALSK